MVYPTKVFSITARAKAKLVADYVVEMLQKEDKLVVFAHHDTMLSALQRRLKKLEVCHVRIDGKTPSPTRPALLKKFQEEARVALLGITALGQGISLTAARVAIFAELHW